MQATVVSWYIQP